MSDKKIQDYLHLYLGCELMEVGNNRGKLYAIGLLGGDGNFRVLTDCSSNDSYWTSINNVKPILHRLEDMTEEERRKLWKFIFKREFHKSGSTVFIRESNLSSDPRFVMSSGVERLGIEMNGTVWADSDLHLWKHNQHEVTRWLLLKQFDLFNLIPEGLALDAATINQPQ